MAIGTLEHHEAAPARLKAPTTWGELQAFNSIVPSQFYAERSAALSDPSRGSAVAAIDSTLARAAWSRRDTDEASEPLPAELRNAARELLDLIGIRQSEGVMDRMKEAGANVAERVRGFISSVRARFTAAEVLDS